MFQVGTYLSDKLQSSAGRKCEKTSRPTENAYQYMYGSHIEVYTPILVVARGDLPASRVTAVKDERS